MLDIEADYQMQAPLHGSLYLDSFKIEIQEARVEGRQLEWECDASDEVLGERLHLKGFEGEPKACGLQRDAFGPMAGYFTVAHGRGFVRACRPDWKECSPWKPFDK